MHRRDSIPAKPEPRAAAITQLTLTVFRLNGMLLHWGDQVVEPLGLTSARWQMLGALALASTPLTAPQVGEAMGVTRQGAQKQLNLLRFRLPTDEARQLAWRAGKSVSTRHRMSLRHVAPTSTWFPSAG